jgi:hypothetical protein
MSLHRRLPSDPTNLLELKNEQFALAGLDYEERRTAQCYLTGALANLVPPEKWAETVRLVIEWVHEDRKRRAGREGGAA